MADLDPMTRSRSSRPKVRAYLDEGRFDAQESLKVFPSGQVHRGVPAHETDWGPFMPATGASRTLATWEGLDAG